MYKDNPILNKSKEFAIRIVKLRKYLRFKQKEYDISAQIVRSGTSIGANIGEAVISFSKADFTYKMNTALKEACETEYWLEILHETNYISDKEFKAFMMIAENCQRCLPQLSKQAKETNNCTL